jgi:hypothetical protein
MGDMSGGEAYRIRVRPGPSCHAHRLTGICCSPEYIRNGQGNGTSPRLQHSSDSRDALDQRAALVILGRVALHHVLAQRFGEFGQKVDRLVGHETPEMRQC